MFKQAKVQTRRIQSRWTVNQEHLERSLSKATCLRSRDGYTKPSQVSVLEHGFIMIMDYCINIGLPSYDPGNAATTLPCTLPLSSHTS